MNARHVCFGTAAILLGGLLLAAGFRLGRPSRPEEGAVHPTPRTAYVIHEFSWRYRDPRWPLLQDDDRPGKPVMAFHDRAHADAHCRQLNLQKRATTNPFRYLPAGAAYTKMGQSAFLDFIRAEGLTPPAAFPGEDDIAWVWAEWWDKNGEKWDKARIERLWNALDGLAFYEVVEVPGEP